MLYVRLRDPASGVDNGLCKIRCIRIADRIAHGHVTSNDKTLAHRRVKWDDPYGGECDDTFVLTEGGDEMQQVTIIAHHVHDWHLAGSRLPCFKALMTPSYGAKTLLTMACTCAANGHVLPGDAATHQPEVRLNTDCESSPSWLSLFNARAKT